MNDRSTSILPPRRITTGRRYNTIQYKLQSANYNKMSTGAVDHDILVRLLQLSYGVGSSVLAWVVSFLTGCTQQVCYNGHLSAISSLIFRVPPGSSCRLYNIRLRCSTWLSNCGLKHWWYTDLDQHSGLQCIVAMCVFQSASKTSNSGWAETGSNGIRTRQKSSG